MPNFMRIEYPGTMEQWNAIEKSYNPNWISSSYTRENIRIYCSDGTLNYFGQEV